MVAQWEPGTQYNIGDIVEFEGHRYKIIQPHRSQSDWSPSITPALWGKLPDIAEHHEERHHEHHEHHEEKPWTEHVTQKVEVTEEEKEKHWYDLSDDRKKKLEVGGGLALGLGAITAGYFAYKEHEKSEEEKKAQVWGLQNWLKDAQDRTEEFYRHGPKAPTTWVLVHGKNIPKGAIIGGEEDGQPIYVARAFHEGSVQVGKAGPQFEKGAVIGYGHHEIHLDTYEILLGDSQAIRWISWEGKLKPYELNGRLVEGGYEHDRTPLYVAQARHGNATIPGKASINLDGALLPYGGTEKRENHYSVLAYA